MPVTVSLVEDSPAVAAELEKHIRSDAGLRFLHHWPDGESALAALPSAPPDVLVVDLRLPGMSGVELISRLRPLCPEVQCLVLTLYAESELIFSALKAGACGYLLKRSRPSLISDGIRQIHAGGSVMTPSIARRVLEMFAVPEKVDTPPEEELNLTERERRVLGLMVAGQPRKCIVGELGINVHTLDYVIRCIYRKLHVSSLASAVSTAVQRGLVGKGR